jgi:hypothetical protein
MAAKGSNHNTTLLLVSMQEKEKITRLYEEVAPNELATEVGEQLKERDQWANRVEYMLSVIGYVVDLGSELWRIGMITFICLKIK